MAIPAVGDLIRMDIVAYHTPSSQIGVNTHFQVVTGRVGTGLDLDEMCTAQQAIVEPVWGPFNDSSVGLAGIRAYLINRTTGKATDKGVSLSTKIGDLDEGILPSQVAVVAQKVTTTVGRGKSGRVYLPFVISTAALDNGELDPASSAVMLAYLNGAWNTHWLVSGGNQTQIMPVVTHMPLPLTWAPVTGYKITGKFGTQRSRGDYGRPNPQEL